MVFGDEAKALHLLQNISYYRLSGYWYPLLTDKQQHIFKPGSIFEAAYNIYKFDSELRKLIIAELEKIEVAVRTQTAYILSSQYHAHWFEDSALFSNPVRHAKILSKIDEEYSRSDEEFITAFKAKYSDHFPPSWITMEIASFGTLSILYENLQPGHAKRSIAAYFGLADKVFASWLHCIVYVRNICAHHSRLWNRSLSIRPLMPRSPRNTADLFRIEHDHLSAEHSQSEPFVCSKVLRTSEALSVNRCTRNGIPGRLEKRKSLERQNVKQTMSIT